MSQWERASPGQKRRSESTDKDRLGHSRPHSQNLYSSQSSEGSSSHQGSLDDRYFNPSDRQSRLAYQPHRTPEAILTHLEASLQASSAPFTLPSLSLTNPTAYTLPPIPLPSPRASRLSVLTQEQGSNDMPIQTLQHDNASLISAYSTAQTRVADLEEEVRVSRLEIAKLVKERQRLEAKVDLLEAEIEELQNTMEVSQQHTAAKDAQYSHIVELSTKLQTQGVAEAQQRRTERERWAHDKQNMERTITMLRSEVRQLRKNAQRSITSYMDGSGLPEPEPTVTDQAEPETQLDALECGNANTEDTLAEIRKQHTDLMDLIEKLASIGRSMQTRMQSLDTDHSSPQKPGE